MAIVAKNPDIQCTIVSILFFLILWHFDSFVRTQNNAGFPVHILQTALTGTILVIA